MDITKMTFFCTHADFSELVIVLSGTATHVVDGEEYPIRKGDVFVISNDTAHSYKQPKNFHICNIMFHLSYFLDFQSDIKTTAGFHALFIIEPTLTKTQGFKRQLTLNLAQYDEIHGLIQRLMDEYNKKLSGYQTMIISLLSQLITSLSRYYTISQKSDSNYFSRKFKLETGKSPMEYRKYFQGLSNPIPIS